MARSTERGLKTLKAASGQETAPGSTASTTRAPPAIPLTISLRPLQATAQPEGDLEHPRFQVAPWHWSTTCMSSSAQMSTSTIDNSSFSGRRLAVVLGPDGSSPS